jgi:cell division protein FtsL
MNFLGKVFIVLVLVLSVVFMSFAIVVYTTHRNWRELAEQQSTKLQDLNAQISKLKADHDQKIEQLDAARVAEVQQAAKLETERATLAETNTRIQGDLNALRQQERERLAAFTATQKNNEDLAGQVAELAKQKRDSELARDAQYAQMLAATEQRNQLVGQLETAMERNMQLTGEVSRMTAAMQANGLNPATDANAITPTVDGIVSQIRRSGGVQYVEVSIGADDGLKAGDTVEVFRGNRYLGRLNIRETSPDKSIGEVIRSFQQGQIQEGDRVATRLNF